MSEEESLKMFLWESELKAEYDKGQLIVLAMNIDEARSWIREHFRKRELKMREDELDILEEDISKDPKIYNEYDVIEIAGSD